MFLMGASISHYWRDTSQLEIGLYHASTSVMIKIWHWASPPTVSHLSSIETWPLLVYNYNLPPDERFKSENMICLGIIPGPQKPWDFDSFLQPFVEEGIQLELGVGAYDVLSGSSFTFRAFFILAFGDMPAVAMLMQMKGPNGLYPCRFCHIQGITCSNANNNTHYVPLDRSKHPDVRKRGSTVDKKYNANCLPLRTSTEYEDQAHHVQSATSQAEADRRAKASGIKGVAILSQLSALSFPHSFPYEFMHPIWENVVALLMSLWTNSFKQVNTNLSDGYYLNKDVWADIWSFSKQAGSTIPSAYGPRMPDSKPDSIPWTADIRSIWFLLMAPVLLCNRFWEDKFYTHVLDLVTLVNKCLQYDLPRHEVSTIRQGLIKWVKDYEK
jgi:hypothetical protein